MFYQDSVISNHTITYRNILQYHISIVAQYCIPALPCDAAPEECKQK